MLLIRRSDVTLLRLQRRTLLHSNVTPVMIQRPTSLGFRLQTCSDSDVTLVTKGTEIGHSPAVETARKSRLAQ